MRVFLLFVLVFIVANSLMAGIIYMSQFPGGDQQRDDQLDRIEEKLDTLIEIGGSGNDGTYRVCSNEQRQDRC